MAQRATPGLAFLSEGRPVESFEQLDSTLRIVGVGNWVVLAVLFSTLVAFGVFSWFYKVPLKVDGRGIMLDRSEVDVDPLLQITAPASGRLSRVEVKIGSTVHRGQVIASIDQSDLRDQIREAEEDRKRLRDEDERLTRFDADEAKSRSQALGELERALTRNLKHGRERLTIARRIAEGDLRLNRQRMLNDSDALKSRADSDAVESEIGTVEARLFELDYERLQDQTARDREKLKRTLGIRAAETKLDVLRQRLERDTRIVSPYSGKLVDLTVTPHALIEKGALAALLQPERIHEPLEAVVFVPAGQGKKIRVGDDVEVSPDTVRRHEHGFVFGKVLSISEIPATEMAMLAELKHKTLVANFVEQYAGQVLLSIHVKLEDVRDAGAPTRPWAADRANWLRWSSTSGAAQRVSTGTLCSASIVVERRPLITLAFPWVKQLVGIY